MRTASRIRFWSIVAIIATAYLHTGILCEEWLLTRYNLIALGLSLLYSLGCIFVQPWCEASGSLHRNVAYFAVQVPLVSSVLMLAPVSGPGVYFLLPLLSQAFFVFPVRIAIWISALLFALSLAHLGLPHGWLLALKYTPAYAAAFIFVAGLSHLLVREIAARERAVRLGRELAEANAQLRARAAEGEELAVTRERNRLAREIHDGLGHYLTAIALQTEAAEQLLPLHPERAVGSVTNARTLAQEALTDVRQSVQALRTDVGQPSMEMQLQQLAARATDLTVVLEVRGPARRLSSAAEHALVRTAQEGLTNVRKHAATHEATVTLDFTVPTRIALEVRNAGRGSADLPHEGFGLRGLRERIELLGGTLRAGSGPTGGFVLRVEVPA